MEPRPFSHGYEGWWCILDLDHRCLQWSHDLSVMDTRHSRRVRSENTRPSMEPRPFSHGYDRAGERTGCRGSTFNGATTFQSWILRGYAETVRRIYAFNGATTFQSWIPDTGAAVRSSVAFLQWSHDLSVMDTWRLSVLILTMGILQWSHDLSVMDTRCACRQSRQSIAPSMEPRPFSHGYRPKRERRPCKESILQWSHDLSVMDTSPLK